MKKVDPSKLALAHVRALEAYEAKEIQCRVKLDANESPYCPLTSTEIFSDDDVLCSLNRYPDPEAKALRQAFAKTLKINDKNILFGNGSDELIYYLITTFGGPVLFPVPTFVMYGVIAQSLGVRKIAVPLDRTFDLDLAKMLASVKIDRPKLVFLSSPNNPTGNCYATERILRIIDASKGIVVVDEAYQPFSSQRGFLPFLKDFENLVILRTMSKIGFAALRVGYMIADEKIINEVNKVRLPYNLNALSQAAAFKGIRNKKTVETLVKAIADEREWLSDELSSLDGVLPYPSEANFILFQVAEPEKVFKGLLKQGVLIKNMNRAIKYAMRVTVGSHDENVIFIDALKKVMNK